MTKLIELSEDQVLWFRARRSHLAGPGAPDVATAARAVLGAQAQQQPPALLALSQRTRGRPTAREVQSRLEDDLRVLVRTWGQRETLHIYDAQTDWPDVIHAQKLWSPGGRRGAMPDAAAVKSARKALAQSAGLVTRTDFIPAVPKKLLDEAIEKLGDPGDARRFAAGRLLWRLCVLGEACVAHKVGSEQVYAARTHWFADLDWPSTEPAAAATRLTRRYLSTFGPATVQDIAHHFGAKVSAAREWVGALDRDDELIRVTCGPRTELIALAGDRAELSKKPPADAGKWPIRLLPLYDCHLMAHADKSWTVPVEADRKQIWRKAAFVVPVVVARGRFVATWKQTKRAKKLEVTVTPLTGWRKSKHAAGVRTEARAVANHFGLETAEVELA